MGPNLVEINGSNMEVSIVLLISCITLFVGYVIGKKEGLSNGYIKGIYEGAEETLKLVEMSSNG